MKIIDRYVFGEISRPALLGVGVYTFVLLMNQFFLIARQAIQKDLGTLVVSELILLELPRVLLLTIPMGVLLGVLVGLGRLSADSEIVALRAGGVSYLRLVRPVALLGLSGFAAGLLLYHLVAPAAHGESAKLTTAVLARSDLNLEVRPRVFYDSIPGLVLYAEEIDRSDREWPLRGLFVRTEEPGSGSERILIGRRGRVDQDPDTGFLSFRVDRGELHVYNPATPASYNFSRFSEPFRQVFRPEGAILSSDVETGDRKAMQDMSWTELNDFISRKYERAGQGGPDLEEHFKLGKALVERSQRTAVPFAAIAFAVLGLPLGIATRRGGRSSGFAISLLVIIAYWVAFSMTRDMALQGKIPIFAGVWGPNLVLLGSGLALTLLRQRNERFTLFGTLSARIGELAARLPGLRGGIAAGSRARALSGPSTGETQPPTPRPSRVSTIGVSILDRHIAALYARTMLLVVLSVYTIVWVVLSRNLLDSIVQADLPMTLLLRYILYFTPGAAWYVLPIACLVSALVAIGLLERNNEITAMKAAGISLYRVSAPLLITTLGVCALYFIVQDSIAPAANQEALRIEDKIEGRTGTVAPGTRWIFGDDRRLYAYHGFDSTTLTFQGLSVFDLSEGGRGVKRRVWADTATWSGEGWRVVSGWERVWRENGERLAVDRYRPLRDETLVYPEGPEFFAGREKSFLRGSRLPEEMSFQQLRRHLDETKRSGYDVTNLKVALYAKTAFPFTPLVMVLIGLPFAFQAGRKGSLYGLGISLGLVIVYWALFAVFDALGLEGIVPAALAPWLPNLLFSLGGIYMLLSVRS